MSKPVSKSQFKRLVAQRAYPAWICSTCGSKFGHWPEGHVATFHDGDPTDPRDRCGWCGSPTSLTEPRDYGYPEFKP